MPSWQPPIPSGALYSPQSIALGPGLALLAWCYDQVERDGSIQISLEKAAADIGKPYGTIRDWWKALRGSEGKSPFFSEITPCGRKGWRVVFRSRWLDWRIMRQNYPERRDFSDEDNFSADISADNHEPDIEHELSADISALSTNSAEKPAVSSQFERRDFSDEGSACKVLMDDQESPPPPETKTQPPRANAADAAGGGGGEGANAPSRWRNHPVYALLAQPKYGILSADRLMADWQDAPPDQVRALLERLYKQHYSANAPNQVAGRMYRALQAGPDALLRPPARAAPPPAPHPTPVPRSDARAIAAIFVEGRPNGKPPAD